MECWLQISIASLITIGVTFAVTISIQKVIINKNKDSSVTINEDIEINGPHNDYVGRDRK